MTEPRTYANTKMADVIEPEIEFNSTSAAPVKLNLGCASRKFHGWINIDVRKEVNPDVVDDVFTLSSFEKSSVDIIYASHLLEHVKRKEIKNVLATWRQLLKPNGVLRISVPDFKKVVKYYLLTSDLEKLHGLLHGGQRNEHDIHYITFDYELLREYLIDVGFLKEDIRIYSFMETDHFFIDDGSQAFLPHMDKVNGMLMSLNVEATKNDY